MEVNEGKVVAAVIGFVVDSGFLFKVLASSIFSVVCPNSPPLGVAENRLEVVGLVYSVLDSSAFLLLFAFIATGLIKEASVGGLSVNSTPFDTFEVPPKAGD